MEFLDGTGLTGFIGGAATGLVVIPILMALWYRRVVPTNEVHIIQSNKATTSYGKDTGNGNVYYEWPSWIPMFGISKVELPVSVFDLELKDYAAYDKGRLPFVVDIRAFFRIEDSNLAAQRVESFDQLMSQLQAIVESAVRVVLAGSELHEIMQGRSAFGEKFTQEVDSNLESWGVKSVKNIEMTDIDDSPGSHVIKNIMEKKKSHIEMESRTEVAANKQKAQIAEIEAQREVDLQKQSAEQSVGLRTAENKREVGVANQQALQVVREQERITKEKDMAVISVEKVKGAEIARDVEIVRAEQDRKSAIILAEGQRDQTIRIAEGDLEKAKKEAQGIEATGLANAAAAKAMQMAPVEAQIVLAKEIGENEKYQTYLITVDKIKAAKEVGIEQAKALEKADIKVIANTGSPTAGITNVMDLMSSKGGTEIGAMLEGLAQTETGGKVLKTLGVMTEKTTTQPREELN